MNWDQIEHKWAAMTRRVRADLTLAQPEALPKLPLPKPSLRSARPDKTPVGAAVRKAGLDMPARSTTLNE